MLTDSLNERTFFTGRFYCKGVPLDDGPSYGMTLKAAGSMRFRWNEHNPVRDAFLKNLAGSGHEIAAVELIHSQTVFAPDSAGELFGMQGDGIITDNKKIIPVVTVADCMPIYLYDPVTKVFGMLHSGWKGTGIVRNAVELAEKKYGCDRHDFCVVMGPHIHGCCYLVGEERAQYFRVNFTPDCVEPEKLSLDKYGMKNGSYHLSLAKANLALLLEMGLDEDSIVTYNDCTCCDPMFGSFRRETKDLPADMDIQEKQKHFTVQAAWVKW
ncbi:MAG: polyphenol oxidase family protein [Treponema sp.]|nr:polyphenol oxidase family protein [Treponema sp.]MBQ2552396.1 polyphenol oxidase family protein [Treponema sp.]MBQ4236512.1 polyphenol oxidase family protein [Treponema sp.]